MNQQQKNLLPPFLLPFIHNTNDMSSAAFNITPTTMITNHNNDQYTEVLLNSNDRTAMKTTNVSDGRQYQRDKEKGEREQRQDDIKRTWAMKECTRQTNKNIDLVTSCTNEQYNCPDVNDSMANYFPSTFNSNNISLSNNRHFRVYEPSYPSINRSRTSSSPYRKTHYLDDSDEEIIHDEILEIINLDHYPTLIERWGDDTKPIIRQQGEFKIEDYVEFEETEPTIFEEISYEIIYSGNEIKSTREIHHSRSTSRNFRKIKKRRIKRKRIPQLFHQIHHLSQYDDLSSENIYEIPSSIINGLRPPNIDLISEDTSLQSFESDEHKKIVKQGYENKRQEEIDQSHGSFNGIISRIESSINESNDNQTKKLQSTVSQVDQEETIGTPVQPTSTKDELTPSSIDQDLGSFLNLLLSRLIPDSFHENEQPLSDAGSDDLISPDQTNNETTITIDEHQVAPVESNQPIIQSKELTTSIDHQSPIQFESTETIPVRDILVTSLPLHLPSADLKAEKPSINSLVEIIQQINTIPLTSVSKTENRTVQQTCEVENQSESNLIPTTTESVQKPSIDETTASSDFPVALVNIHLPSTDIKTEITYTEEENNEKSIANLTAEVDKQSETISTQSTITIIPEEEISQKTYVSKNESIRNNSVIEPADTIIFDKQPPSIPPKTKEDENVERSSDFLADIVPQIITTASTIHRPSVNHPEQLIDQSAEDSLNETTEQSNITSPPSVNAEDNEPLESNQTITETISDDEHLISNVLIEAVPSSIRSISHANESTSPVTDICAQTNPKPSIQDNVSNELDLLLASIVSESPGSTDENESLYYTDENLHQAPEINPINQSTTESSYSISELTNIMNNILVLPMTTPSEKLTDVPQHPAITEQISSPNCVVSELPTLSETDSNDLHQHRDFPFTIIDQTSSNFTSVNPEQSDAKKTTFDLTKIYYELQEQRHIQPVFNDVKIEQQPKTSDAHLNNPNEHLDLPSFSLVSNLPSREYRQVFGVPDEIFNTVNDLTYYVDQKLQSIDTNEKTQITETSEDHQSILSTDQKEIINPTTASITSNAELDLRYSSLLDRIHTLINPLLDLPSSTFTAENQSIPTKFEEPNLIDVVYNIANEETSTSSSDKDASKEKDVQASVSTMTDLKTSTTEPMESNDEILTPVVTDNEVIVSKSSEEIATKAEDEEQHQPSLPGLFEIMKNLFPSTLLSKTSTETSLEGTQQQEYSTEDQQKEVSKTPVQSSTTKEEEEEEQHGILDLVVDTISNIKETISNLGPSNEKTTILESPSNAPDNSDNHTRQSAVFHNDKEQQTMIKTVEEMIDNTSEKTVSTQEQVVPIPKQSISSNYPWYASQYKVAATEFDRLSATDQSSTIDQEQRDQIEKKAPHQQLQVINDDYPWYSSYYTIVDAEAKFARLYKQLNLSRDQPSLPTTVIIQSELEEKATTQSHELQDEDEDGFHLVQRRKRIPSSTTHEKTVLSTILTTKPPVSPDIDLKPVVLHGHPDELMPISPIIPQSVDTTSKKKHKKKKKDKKEMILFDAPEPSSLSDTNKQKIDATQPQSVEEKQDQENMKMNDSVPIDQTLKHELEESHAVPTIISEDQKPEISSTSIVSNTETLNEVDETTNESTSPDNSQLLTTPVTTLPENVKVDTELTERQPIDQEPIVQSPPSSVETTAETVRTQITLPSQEEEEDNEGFQLVHNRKRLLSAAKSEQTSPSTPSSKEILSSDIDQRTSVILEHQSLPTSTATNPQSPTSTANNPQSPTSKKKKNKHKKYKKEVDSSSTIDSNKVEQEPADQETVSQSYVSSPSSSITEDSNIQSNLTVPPTINTTTISKKSTASPEEEADDEGFQVVSYRRHITSTPRSANTPSSSSSKAKHEQNIGRNVDHKRVVHHGRHGSASPSIPRSTNTTKAPSDQNKQVILKQDKKQTTLFDTPPRSTSAETHIITPTDSSFRTPQNLKQKTARPLPTSDKHQQQLQDPKQETTVDVKPKLDHSSSVEQPTNHIVEERHASTKEEIKTAYQQASLEEIIPSTTMNDSNTDTAKSTLTKDDSDGFQVAGHPKDIPSSAISTVSKNDSSSSTTAPELVIPPITISKKKSKINKDNTFPSVTTADIDFIPLSVEETIDQKPSDEVQQVSKPQIVSLTNSSDSSTVTLTNTANETAASQITEPVYQIDEPQNQLHSIQSITSSTSAVEEVASPSKELSGKVDDLSMIQPVRSIDIPSTTNQIDEEVITKETPATTSIEPTLKTEDEHTKTTSIKKPAKRRKKKSRTREKPDDENVVTSATGITLPNIESNVQKSDNVKQESNSTLAQTSTSAETRTTQSFASPTNTSEIFSKEINSKLDLFLPEYIRQQINTHPTSSSIPTPSSNIIQKKKPRPKMLKKDHEAKSLLTNEFDNTEKQSAQQTIVINDDNINDDDEFIVQTSPSPLPDKSTNNSTQQNIDNILSRGFYLWLQESQAISQQKDNSTNIIQSIVIQPVTTNNLDENEDSYTASKAIKPTYMISRQPNKSIHTTNAYFINHPESISTPSWLIAQSNDNTFSDNPEKFDPENDEDSIHDQSKEQTDTQSHSNNNSHQQTNFTTDNLQQCFGKNLYRQIEHHPSINFDDWAYFLEEKNSYYLGNDLSTSLECFYTRTFDEDTLISNVIPIHYSIDNERQRYGDFLSTNTDESLIKLPSYKSKPSAYFQNYRKQSQTDDEIFISHSNDGLSRRVRL